MTIYYTAGVPLLVLLMPWALDHLRTVPLRTPPHSSQLLAEFASVRWNGPGQLKVPHLNPHSVTLELLGLRPAPCGPTVRGNVYYFWC